MIKQMFLILIISGFSCVLKGQMSSGKFRIDDCLRQMNVKAWMDYPGFLSELEKTYHFPAARLDSLHTELKMQPADIYMTLEIGRFSNQPMEVIIRNYQQRRKGKWSDIAGEFGIKPGSVEFQVIRESARLKSGNPDLKKTKKNQLINPKSSHKK